MSDKNFSIMITEKEGKLYIDVKHNEKIKEISVKVNEKELSNDSKSVFSTSLPCSKLKRYSFINQFVDWWVNPNVEVPAPEVLLALDFSTEELIEMKVMAHKNLSKQLIVGLPETNPSGVLSDSQTVKVLSDLKNNSDDLTKIDFGDSIGV